MTRLEVFMIEREAISSPIGDPRTPMKKIKKLKVDPKKPLVLTSTTIRPLDDKDLQQVGGAGPMTYSRCYCN